MTNRKSNSTKKIENFKGGGWHNRKSDSTKKALYTNVLCLILCIAMLIGTTFAWFTDSVSSGKNTITAGNLDVELEYVKPSGLVSETELSGQTWTSVEGSTDLFEDNKSTLWEPGHMEVVYLKISNNGTLAVDYKLLAYAKAETEGTNVNGEPFRLSDVLEFYLVNLNATDKGKDINSREAVTEKIKNQSTFKLGEYPKEETALESGKKKYVALVVYMPTTVGNEANYTGNTIPTIDLGVRLEATQAEFESDSFGNDYDANADGTPDHSEFGTVPTTSLTKTESAALTGNKDADAETYTLTATTTNSPSSDGSGTTVKMEGVSSSLLEDKVNVVTTNAAEISSANYQVESDQAVVASIDLSLASGTKFENGKATITTYIAKGLESNPTVKYNGTGEAPTFVSYSKETGELVFTTTHFSEYYVVASDAVALVGNTAYDTLGSAVADAQDGDTVVLLRNAAGGGVKIDTSKKSLTLDLSGYTYTVGAPTVGSKGTETSGFQLLKGGYVTFKNGTLKCTNYENLKRAIQNYCNLTLENIVLDAREMVGDGLIVMASNNGVVNLTGNTSILAKSGDDALAVGWAYPQMTSYIDGTQVTVNTTGKIDGGVYMCFWSETCKTTTNKSTLTIKNGTFNGDLTIADGFDTNNLIIKGGTFNGENWPSQTVTTTK